MNGQDIAPFLRLVAALEPWLDQVVIVGGWAHRLYRLHPLSQELDYTPLMTLDTDIAIPAKLQAGEPEIRKRLLDQGFREELLGDDHPPATHYQLMGQTDGFYAEFLTPLIGGPYDRKHERKATIDVGGIVAQQLRHIEILLGFPWRIDLPGTNGTIALQIANPVSLLAQKILIHSKRDRNDRAKDILYIHDTIEVFGAHLPQLRSLWKADLARRLQTRSAKSVSKAADALFGELTDDVRRAAEVIPQRELTPKDIQEACHHGLSAIFE